MTAARVLIGTIAGTWIAVLAVILASAPVSFAGVLPAVASLPWLLAASVPAVLAAGGWWWRRERRLGFGARRGINRAATPLSSHTGAHGEY